MKKRLATVSVSIDAANCIRALSGLLLVLHQIGLL